ncbi:hypothetical protein [Roseomonas sp. 18066]|uniref:calcium-binding protein n=1 Tax=Roseomonas sp. 18066 TaxID=2681412 RepID=UPI00135C5087|nr:hypothetical protein [Roseomonas sp. 18066]
MAVTRTGTNGPDLLLGTAEDDILLGLAGDDRLEGGEGRDLLDGGMGNDVMLGGLGDDTYVVNKETDQVIELPGEGYDTVRSGVSWTLGASQEALVMATLLAVTGIGNGLANLIIGSQADNLLRGLDGDDRLEGRDGNDALQGGNGNDWLDGGRGDDVMHGGLGDDTYVVDSTADRVAELRDQGYDTLRSSVAWTLGDNLEKLVLTGAALNGTGNALDNVIIGTAGDNVLKGEAGDDRLEGGAGDDDLDGGMGNDLMLGGAGNDRYTVNKATDRAFEFAGQGIDEVVASVSYTLGSHVENLRLVGGSALVGIGNVLDNSITGSAAANTLQGRDGDDSLYGMDGDDRLEGGEGHDLLDGGAGNDVLVGGLGDDRYVVGLGDQIFETAAGGYDTVVSRGSWTLGAHLEALLLVGTSRATGTGNGLANLITGTSLTDTLRGLGGDDLLQGMAGHDTLEGGSGNDRLEGGAGDDTLDGGMGDDVMLGGLGDDTYVVSKLEDQTIELAGEGFDRVLAGIAWTLADNIEALTLTGSGALAGRGNALANELIGNAGANALYGLDGDDWLEGKGGHDILDGGAGNDSMLGGTGNDTYYVDSAGDEAVEGIGQGTDTVIASLDWTLGASLENLTLVGGAREGRGNAIHNHIIGNALDNILSGFAGNDILEGGGGNDMLIGGSGDDLYIVPAGEGAVTIVEEYNGAFDTIHSWRSIAAPSDVEAIVLMGEDDIDGAAGWVRGNAGDNVLRGLHLTGGDGDDTYVTSVRFKYHNGAEEDWVSFTAPSVNEGADGGIDTVIWQSGNDFVYPGRPEGEPNFLFRWILAAHVENLVLLQEQWGVDGNDLDNHITGSDGNDIVGGGAGHDTMLGGAGRDTLTGSLGDDILVGGLGADRLAGDAGRDAFRFTAAAEGGDTIADFTLGEDVIEISAAGFGGGLVAGVALGGAQFVANAGGTATATQAQLLFDTTDRSLWWDADGTAQIGAVLLARFDTPVAGFAASDIQIIA